MYRTGRTNLFPSRNAAFPPCEVRKPSADPFQNTPLFVWVMGGGFARVRPGWSENIEEKTPPPPLDHNSPKSDAFERLFPLISAVVVGSSDQLLACVKHLFSTRCPSE